MIDEGGKVKSALYGKIDGEFGLDAINSKTCFVLFTYYLNPTSNDRNMEFNPQKNLFTDLTSDERLSYHKSRFASMRRTPLIIAAVIMALMILPSASGFCAGSIRSTL